MTETLQILTGREIAASLPAVAELRLAIFREYPYLYAGDAASEQKYLAVYADAADACLVTVNAGNSVAGAATGIPLSLETGELVNPFAASAYEVDNCYYIGELLFYPAFRNRGLGSRVLKLIEERVRSLGRYRYLTCVTVVRPAGHPLCPADYLPIDRFLARTGFKPLPGICANFTWSELDGVRREHGMQYWLKEL